MRAGRNGEIKDTQFRAEFIQLRTVVDFIQSRVSEDVSRLALATNRHAEGRSQWKLDPSADSGCRHRDVRLCPRRKLARLPTCHVVCERDSTDESAPISDSR
jgi:hypothetical protein